MISLFHMRREWIAPLVLDSFDGLRASECDRGPSHNTHGKGRLGLNWAESEGGKGRLFTAQELVEVGGPLILFPGRYGASTRRVHRHAAAQQWCRRDLQ